MQMKKDNNQGSDNSLLSGLKKEGGPLIIAGPCSAETEDQVMEIAENLASDGRVDYFRAGVWKPRTSPGSFQGVEKEGLKWLQEVKKQTGLKVSTEVGSTKHVEEALEAGVDMIWIGARTVSNPFLIQDLAESLRGVDIPVLVKNPLGPDLDLWEGSLKRFIQVGVKQLGAIHRGFFWWGNSPLRNIPLWHIPLNLRKRMPDIPIICDPSHLAGKSSLIPLLAQRAMENKFSGLMIEVHNNPDKAWSDASQQLTPSLFHSLLDDLLASKTKDISYQNLIEELRAELDIMDEMILWALSERMNLAGKIGQVKKEANIKPLQKGRWEEVLERMKNMATQSGLDPDFVENLFSVIHDESLRHQRSLLDKKNENNFAV